MINKQKIIQWIDYLGLALIGIWSLGYFTYSRRFAELNIQLPFLDFPIFMGEILLFVLSGLVVCKWLVNPKKLTKVHVFILACLCFIATKALMGYSVWGPLALRHSAMYYYLLFIGLGYSFFRREFFHPIIIGVVLVLYYLIYHFLFFYTYYTFTVIILNIALILILKNKWLKIALLILLLVVFPYPHILYASRTMIIGHVLAMVFIIGATLLTLSFSKKTKIITGVVLILVVGVGFGLISDHNAIKSMVHFDALKDYYKTSRQIQAKNKRTFVPRSNEKVKLFNPEPRPAGDPFFDRPSEEELEKIARKEEAMLAKAALSGEEEVERVKKLQEKKEEPKRDPKPRDINVAYNNIFFRFFIWEDMLNHLIDQKPILGFDFGMPLRSESIEILRWGAGEWERDGWVGAHNSYLHMIYRAGFFAFIFIGLILMLLLRIMKRAIQFKSLNGILLCGILVYWVVAANFLLIFELPYNCIPFWCLFGITYAYLEETKTTKEKNENTNHT